jgi:probable F420-dependent oxidoreductase
LQLVHPFTSSSTPRLKATVRPDPASGSETVEDGSTPSGLQQTAKVVGKERSMKLGVIVPQKEIGLDAGALRAFAQGAEDLGFHHLVAFDSVFTENPYHEPLALFAFLAGCTTQIELVTGVIVAPSRQTVLLAKQATSVDVLSQGRLRLGLGVGWNQAEFRAMRAEFAQRGDQIEEQIRILRAMWTQPVVTFQGTWHTVTEAHQSPLPIQRPIPIWLGGHAEAVLQRVGRQGDGWIPVEMDPTDPETYHHLKGQIARLQEYARAAGRPPEAVGIEAQSGVQLRWGGERAWAKHATAWRVLGATHLSIETMGVGLASPEAHLDALRRIKEVIDG